MTTVAVKTISTQGHLMKQIYLFLCKKLDLSDSTDHTYYHAANTTEDCLFGVLRRFQHCTGHITTGSWKGRGNQYI